MLIEVMMSALLVALIVVATMTGFDVANRATGDERRHAQAIGLAAQANEQLRSDSAATLSELYASPHTYERRLAGTNYTITQEAKPVNAAQSGTGCNATETTTQNGVNVQITSIASWPQQVVAKRPAAKVSGIVTPPTGSGLEVDAQNGGSPLGPVAGVTSILTYTPVESSSTNTLEATTGSAGCALFTAIPATKATVAIKEKANFVTTSGLLKYPSKEVTLAPNVTTHYPITYNEGGKIAAKFTYKGGTEFEREPGKKETVKGDTFVAFNSNLETPPHFEVGSPSFGPESNVGEYESGGEEHYKPLTGTAYFKPIASTPAAARYLSGDLFAFGANEWHVYGGDCPKDSIETVTAATEKLTDPHTLVTAGKSVEVSVPLSYVLLTVKSGIWPKPGALEGTSYEVKIINRECEAEKVTPNNASATNFAHSQKTGEKAAVTEGHLEDPFQPFGKYELCLYNKSNTNRYLWTYTNNTVKGSSNTIYPAEKTTSEWKTEEEANKTKWSKEEKEKGKPTKAERKTKEEKQLQERTEAEEKRGYSIEGGQVSC